MVTCLSMVIPIYGYYPTAISENYKYVFVHGSFALILSLPFSLFTCVASIFSNRELADREIVHKYNILESLMMEKLFMSIIFCFQYAFVCGCFFASLLWHYWLQLSIIWFLAAALLNNPFNWTKNKFMERLVFPSLFNSILTQPNHLLCTYLFIYSTR